MKGYNLVSVVLKKASETQASELAEIRGNYSFDMPDEPVTVIVTVEGKQITIKDSCRSMCCIEYDIHGRQTII